MIEFEITLPEQYEGLDAAIVGGFPRDLYMGRKSNDKDIVVTGVTPEEMRSRGFKHIMSADERKPVFVDDMGREVAIARVEKSTGTGHNDFQMDIVDPEIDHKTALRKDLKRRDLTMNAIAVDIRTKEIFDPFNGRKDIDDGIIRHISSAFTEDPLRVVRVARYVARFGFDIAEETKDIMRRTAPQVAELTMKTSNGELARGRLGEELVKTLKQSKSPREFFDVLKEFDALRYSYPEIEALDYVPAGPYEYHKEGSAYEHTMMVLEEMYKREGNDVASLLAALSHDIGKPATPSNVLPHHYGHEKRGKEIAIKFREELQISRDLCGVMSTSAEIHGNLGNLEELNVTTLLDIGEKIEQSPLSVEQFGYLAESDGQGRVPTIENNHQEISEILRKTVDVINNIGGTEALENRDLEEDDIGESIEPKEMQNLIRQDRSNKLRELL
jgi:tRNA nucleotidyltransferase (CCA-adding enzyme)